jgi:glutamine amidotransferase
MKVAIINYEMGNITSVFNSLRYIGHQPEIVSDCERLSDFGVIVLPGVGAFGKAIEKLNTSGLSKEIIEAASNEKKIVGICLGMQLLFTKSYEFGEHKGLNLVEGEVLPFVTKIDLKVPHMGWNNIESSNHDYKNFEGDYYFVHSYYCKPSNQKDVLFETNYGISFCSGIKNNNNVFGLQFHPEKSQKKGLELFDYIITNG